VPPTPHLPVLRCSLQMAEIEAEHAAAIKRKGGKKAAAAQQQQQDGAANGSTEAAGEETQQEGAAADQQQQQEGEGKASEAAEKPQVGQGAWGCCCPAGFQATQHGLQAALLRLLGRCPRPSRTRGVALACHTTAMFGCTSRWPFAYLAAQVRWWRCCNPKCGNVEPAHTTIANGPGDVLHQADKLWQQGAMLYQVRGGAQ